MSPGTIQPTAQRLSSCAAVRANFRDLPVVIFLDCDVVFSVVVAYEGDLEADYLGFLAKVQKATKYK